MLALAKLGEPAIPSIAERVITTQQPMPCGASARASDREINARAWHTWWERAGPAFRVKSREAELDLQVFPVISPVSIGGRPVR